MLPGQFESTLNLKGTCEHVTTCAEYAFGTGLIGSFASQPYMQYADPKTYTTHLVLASDTTYPIETICAYMYDSNVNNNGKGTSAVASKPNVTTDITGKVLNFMPYRSGYARRFGSFGFIKGKFPTSAADLQPDQLAYYQPCSAYWITTLGEAQAASSSISKTPANFVGMDNPDALQLLSKNFYFIGVYGAWDFDCYPQMSSVCAPNMAATFSLMTTPVGTVSYLAECNQCPANSSSPLGLYATCTCANGFAQMSELRAQFTQQQALRKLFPNSDCDIDYILRYTTERGSIAGHCYNCATDLRIYCKNGASYAQAVRCVLFNGTRTVSPCEAGTYLSNGECTPVTDGYITDEGQTRQFPCPAGTYAIKQQKICRPCAYLPNTYSHEASTACTPKRQNCSTGQMLILDPGNFTSDDQCRPCGSCEAGFVKVVQTGFNSSNPCVGDHFRHFACVSDSLAYGSFVPAGYRVTFNPSNNIDAIGNGYDRVLLERCNASLLPPNAEFIASPPQQVVRQCYFACKYDTGGAATALHDALNALWSDDEARRNNNQIQAFVYPQSITDVNGRVRVPMRWAEDGLSVLLTPASWTVNKLADSASFSQDASNAYAQRFVFYFDDSTLAAMLSNNSDVCKPPASIDTQCTGTMYPGANAQRMWRVDPSLAATPCARLAVTNGIYAIQPDASANAQYVVLGLDPLSQGAPSYVPLCIATTTATNEASAISGWNYACMQEQADATYNAISTLLGRTYSSILSWTEDTQPLINMKRWLDTYNWNDAQTTASVSPYFNPYEFSISAKGVQCAATQTNRNNERLRGSVTVSFTPSLGTTASVSVANLLQLYGLARVSACVPCNAAALDFLNTVCGKLPVGNGQSAMSYDSSRCTKMGHTIAEVCSNCISDATHQIVEASSQAWTNFDAAIEVSPFWDPSKKCRYSCPSSQCSTASRASSYASYIQTPCASCATLKRDAVCPNGYYVNAQTECGAAAEMHVNMCPTMCVACTASNASLLPRLVPFSGAQARSLGECMTICDSSLYHTLLDTGLFATTPVNQSRIVDCVPCLSRPDLLCNGTCPVASWYHPSNQSCLRCNVSVCDKGYYRTGCHNQNAVHDTECTACDPSMLQNPTTPAADPLYGWRPPDIGRSVLNAVLNSVKNTITRRWVQPLPEYRDLAPDALFIQYGVMIVSPSDMNGASSPCYIACKNDMVWVSSSGSYPTTVTGAGTSMYQPQQLWCIPCNSPYFNDANTLSDALPDPPLYSVWNQRNTTPQAPHLNPQVDDMVHGGRLGACYRCPDYRYYTDDKDVLCIIRPGFTDSPSADSTSTSLQMLTNHAVQGAQTVAELYVGGTKAPVLPPNWILGCCNDAPLTDSEFGTCVGMMSLPVFRSYICTKYAKIHNDVTRSDCLRWPDVSRILQTYTCGNYSTLIANYSTSRYNWTQYTRRLLSSQSTDIGACSTGEYKAHSGSGPCAQCPDGASTIYPWNAVTNGDFCACLPGYSSARDASTGRLLSCSPCGIHMYSVYQSANDIACIPCPPNTIAPTPTSGYCTCIDGTYRVTVGSETQCIPCPLNAFCTGEQLFQCPPYSKTPTGADRTSRASCRCDVGYYGDLGSTPDAVCRPLPLAVVCEPGAGMVQENGRCYCASGWLQNWRDNRLFCTLNPSACPLGTYAVISGSGTVTSCVACPQNTYSSSPQMVFNPLRSVDAQCTPCPLSFRTAGNGSSSLSDCKCAGVTIRALGNQSAACGTCQNNTWYNPFTQACEACASGMVATSNGCSCRAGSQVAPGGVGCVKCPIGYYSTSVSISCSACPAGRTTLLAGQTWCVCASTGLFPRMGICI